MLVFHFSPKVLLADTVEMFLQKGLFGGLTLGTNATVQLEFRRADRKPVKAASIKGKGSETEQLPLYTNKDSVVGEVSMCVLSSLFIRSPAQVFPPLSCATLVDQGCQHSWQEG